MSWKHLTHPKTSLFPLGSLKDVCFLTVMLVTPLWILRGTAVLILVLWDTEKTIRTRAQSKEVPTFSNTQVMSLISFSLFSFPCTTPTQSRNIADTTQPSFRREHKAWNIPSGSGRTFLTSKKVWILKLLSDRSLWISSDVSLETEESWARVLGRGPSL